MSGLRQIVRRHQEEASLRKYLQEKFETTSADEKRKLIEYADPMIEKEVDVILDTFINDAWKGSSSRKRQKKLAIVNIILTAFLTTGVAYSVNTENWVMVTIFSLPLLAFQIYLVTEN